MSTYDAQTGLVIPEEHDPPYLPNWLSHPPSLIESLDQIDVYIFSNSDCPLFERAKELSKQLREIAKQAKKPFQVWEDSQYTKDEKGKVLIHWTNEPPPYEVKDEIERLTSEYEDDSRSLAMVLKEIGEWRRRQNQNPIGTPLKIQLHAPSSLIKKKLDAVYERVQELNDRGMRQKLTGGNPLKTILPYELKPVIEEFPVLENEFKRRAFYFPSLAKNKEYLEFIEHLHEQIEDIQSRIDPTKLPSEPRLKRPKHTPPDEDGIDRFWQDMKGIHADLSDRSKWWYLGGEHMPFTVGDSVHAPWKCVLEQYGTVIGLMQNAFESGAMEQTEENIGVYQKFKDDVNKLREMFEKPLHQLHINDFENLAHKMVAPDWMGDEERDIQRTKGYVDRVYKDLMLFLDEHGDDYKVELAPPLARQNSVEAITATDSKIFRYGNSITDCDSHFIWKDGDKEHGQKLIKSAKRRHIWEFCRNICDHGFKSQKELDDFVSKQLGREEHVSVDDMKAFLSVIAQYSDVPLKKLKSDFILFKEGNGIEVKKVP